MAFEVEQRLRGWIGTAVDGDISSDVPQAGRDGHGIGLYLLDMQRAPAGTRPARPSTLDVMFRYLVTAWAPQAAAAHETLAQLYFAAMTSDEFEVDAELPSLELWRSFGIAPQPAFLLRAFLHREPLRPQAKPVRHPVRVEMVSRAVFFGQVLGPQDTPLSNCSVVVPALGLSTSSDREGRFFFSGLPATGGIQFVLRARNHEISVRSERPFPDRATPMLIRFNVLEE